MLESTDILGKIIKIRWCEALRETFNGYEKVWLREIKGYNTKNTIHQISEFGSHLNKKEENSSLYISLEKTGT